MGDIATAFATAFADYDTGGNALRPDKPTIRSIGVTTEATIATLLAAAVLVETNRAQGVETSLSSAIGVVGANLATEVTNRAAAIAALATALAGAITSLSASVNVVAEDATDMATSVQSGAATALAAREAVIVNAAVESAADMVADLGIQKRSATRYLYESTGGTAFGAGSVLHVFWVWGQSLPLGATLGPVLSTTPIYPGRALMPDSGLHPGSGVGALVPLIESTYGGTIYETVCSAFANTLLRDLDAVLAGNNARVAMFVSAVGNQAYYQLKQGSSAYTVGVATIDAICRLVEPQGTRVVAHVIAIQGENDVLNPERYQQSMVEFQREVSADIRRVTGQVQEPLLFVSQMDHVIGAQAPTGVPLQMAQLGAAERSPYICVVGPKYDSPRNPADHIHFTSPGAYIHGMTIERAVFARLFGVAWQPLVPVAWKFVTPPAGVGARLMLDMHVPIEPLVLDTSGAVINATGAGAASPGYGWSVYDTGGNALTISAVTILQATTSTTDGSAPKIAIDLTSTPTTASVLAVYAGRKDDTTNDNLDDGPSTGARGCLRDSAAQVSLYDSSTHNNWMVHWSKWIAYETPFGVWTTYTPTVSAGSGSITAYTSTGRYLQVGKMVFVRIGVTVTTNGTGATYLSATLPFNPAYAFPIFGKEAAVGGKMVQGIAYPGTGNVVQIINYDNSYPASNGAVFYLEGFYEVA